MCNEFLSGLGVALLCGLGVLVVWAIVDVINNPFVRRGFLNKKIEQKIEYLPTRWYVDNEVRKLKEITELEHVDVISRLQKLEAQSTRNKRSHNV